MPIDLEVIQASEFVRLDPQEHLDFEASKQALQALALACQKRGLDRALLDLRTLPLPPKPRFTPTQLAALVRTFRDAGFSRQERLAVLYRSDIHGGVRNFAFMSRMSGLQVQAFTEFEAAFVWLSEQPESQAECHQGEIPVPITKRQSELNKLPPSSTDWAAGRGKVRPSRKPTESRK
jgi:hypothetical protein